MLYDVDAADRTPANQLNDNLFQFLPTLSPRDSLHYCPYSSSSDWSRQRTVSYVARNRNFRLATTEMSIGEPAYLPVLAVVCLLARYKHGDTAVTAIRNAPT